MAAETPLFLRVFALMLICVAVVQLMNFALLVAVQTPSAKLHTVGQIADALAHRQDPTGELAIGEIGPPPPRSWNPRAERIELALAKALGVSAKQVAVHFPTPFLQRERIYDRSSVPAPIAPSDIAVARAALVIGDFVAELRRPDGQWTRVDSSRGFEAWRWFVLAWLVISAVAVAPFAWMLAHRLTKPIGAFAAAAERLGRDPRAEPLQLTGPVEIAEAAAAFNQMQARLNRYVDDRATVVAAVAHDLRTPLMRLGLRVEQAPLALRSACEADIREMQAMISATMAYVRDTSWKGPRRPLDLRSLIETVIDDLSDRGAAVSIVPGEPLVIEGDSVALKALVVNLVGNAVKYAAGCEVRLRQDEGQAVIDVLDRGPGIAEEDLDRMFEPFFRGERSRNRDTGGIGLGLPSARAVARGHGGDVTLANRTGGGVVARVTLPI